MKLQMKKKDKKYEEKIENITEILSKIDSDKVPFEFEFFSGEKNKTFDEVMRSIGLSSDNIDFLDFYNWIFVNVYSYPTN